MALHDIGRMPTGARMTTLARLLDRKQQLLERLQEELGSTEKGEVERLLRQVETALDLLTPRAVTDE
jgi:hypothetical protein